MLNQSAKPNDGPKTPKELYLDLLKKCLTFALWEAKDGSSQPETNPSMKQKIKRFLKGEHVPHLTPEQRRAEGLDWPVLGHTMIGLKRLDNLQFCVERVLADSVPGDLIETGVWRGGATIFMRAILKVYGVTDRRVWVADSFEGLPLPDPEKYPADAGDLHHTYPMLAISLEEVRANFEAYGVLDNQVRFLKGWFRDTLPGAPIEKLAVIRLDGDMYESTMDGLVNLYPKLSPGGFVIIDDYGAVPGCRKAVEDFRQTRGIKNKMEPIDWGGVYWQNV
ncbi:MAG TPA: TylF/MycF family methyltransferase [Haliangiales bacterium]|nr:TylF/MycF family methyltransferase [Haliangiales bacterium]